MSDRVPAPSRNAAKVTAAGIPGTEALLILAVFVVIVTALYFAREVVMPITLAVLLSFVLAPLVNRLRRIHVPRVVAVMLSVMVALSIILALTGLIGLQIANLAGNLPKYQFTIETKATLVQKYTIGRLSDLLTSYGRQVQIVAPPAPPPPASTPRPSPSADPKPVPVQVQEPPLSPLQLAREVLAPVFSPLANGAIVFVVTIFVLLQQDDLRDRLIRLFGSSDLHRTTLALDDAGRRLSRYFLTQLAINAGFGCVICAGLLVIGVPNPVLWGIMGAMLRFVPYVGSWLAGLLPIALASAVDPGWSMALWTIALYGVVELTVGQVVEPFIYGHSTGLSPLSVVVAAIFWSWLWGPIGLILSTPLTLCLVVLGRHVPRLEFLDVILGDSPALTPVESFYQRILANDADEALEQAEQLLRERSLSSYYDEVVLQGLRLAAVDVDRGLLPTDRAQDVVKTVLELVSDLESHEDRDQPTGPAEDSPVAPPERETRLPHRPVAGPDFDKGEGFPVLCIAGRGPLDEAAAAMLAQLLRKHGLAAKAAPHTAVARSQIAGLEASAIAMVCICYIEVSGSPTHLRYLMRRLRQQVPGVPVLIGLWPSSEAILHDDRLRAAIGADVTSDSLTSAVNACLDAAEDRSSIARSDTVPA
ncbi:AI-2E family transporter [Acidisphaera sp. L21]|uniref:AI-2E family transporter n=1 Tax=Acidisphaera sp. L21 TaxID=1641851 RepID=UPI00131D68C4|nr:AI-2E family transporter [Acidisphaera sp. L21]